MFDAPSTTSRERKQLLRAIVSEVVISVDATKRTSALRNHLAWRRMHRSRNDADQDWRAFPRHRRGHRCCGGLAVDYDDTTIALILSRQHRRTGTGAANCWPSRRRAQRDSAQGACKLPSAGISVRRRWLICAACEWHAPSRSTECRSFALELHASICTDLKGDFHSHFLFLTVSALCLRP